MALAIFVATSNIIRARLRALIDSGRCHLVGTVVDGGLRLLHDLIDEDQIVLRPQVVQSRQLILRRGRIHPHLRAPAAHGASAGVILGQPSGAHEGQLTGLDCEQTSLDLRIRFGVKLAALRIIVEIVQGADPMVSNIQVGMVSTIPAMVRGVEDMAKGRRVLLLRWPIVSLRTVGRLMAVAYGRVRLQLMLLLLLVTIIPICYRSENVHVSHPGSYRSGRTGVKHDGCHCSATYACVDRPRRSGHSDWHDSRSAGP